MTAALAFVGAVVIVVVAGGVAGVVALFIMARSR